MIQMVWSQEIASKAYLDTVKELCQNFKEPGVSEFLSAMAAGWNSKLIVESWSYGSPIATSVGLAVAARHTCGRHVCVVPDERSRLGYIKAMEEAGTVSSTAVIVGEAEEVMEGLHDVDFLVVDLKRKDFARVLRCAKLNHDGAVLACKNACHRGISGFRWHGVLEKGTRVVRSLFLPVGQGLHVAHAGANSGGVRIKKCPSRWIKYIDHRSGEEHVFRG
ncbi:ankyrin repeat/KH domain protein [Gossypium australe]|uniref:Ankyrin repeat/KH domain protein n=1 Tax=Gossypium australe TaxID=47621 RepID=A0A5B6VJX3_9ROSI|nr:ankyrin repeat/KH domain protein [Gossypium australe]